MMKKIIKLSGDGGGGGGGGLPHLRDYLQQKNKKIKHK